MKAKSVNMIIHVIFLFVFLFPFNIFAKDYNYNLNELEGCSSSNYDPTGLLKEMYKGPSRYTNLQRKNKLKELAGKIILWRVPVYEISPDAEFNIFDGEKETNRYRIRVTSNDYVGCEILLFTRNDEERNYLNSLKTGDMITIKGVLTGKTTLTRSLQIEPAILSRCQPNYEKKSRTNNTRNGNNSKSRRSRELNGAEKMIGDTILKGLGF